MKRHSPDYIFISLLSLLLIFGLATLISASSVVSFRYYHNSYFLIKQQIFHGIIPGFFLFFFFFKLNYKQLKKITPIFMGISLFLLVLVLIPHVGMLHGSARSWIGLFGISFQPSELAKLFFILYLSLWFSKRKDSDIKSFYQGFLPFSFLLALIILLILMQPDLGTAMVIVLTSIIIYIIAGAKKTHLGIIFLLGILSIFVFLNFATNYQKNRLISFLNPQYDVGGISYHIQQSFLAIGSGGLWGSGFGNSKQKFLFLPKVENDSIFAIIAEELGFFICLLFIGLIMFIVCRGFIIAKKSPDKFTFLVVAGIISWFAVQNITNIGAMIGLMPLTGVTLPLVSLGGSSVMIFGGAFGIISGISCYTKRDRF